MYKTLYFLLIFTIIGCCPQKYSKKLDIATQNIISEKQEFILGKTRDIDLEFHDIDYEKPILLPLSKALEIGYKNSPQIYESNKELYKKALNLINTLHHLSYGEKLELKGMFDIPKREEKNRSLSLEFAKKFASGGKLTLALGAQAASALLGKNLRSLVEAKVTQPLLRGAFKDIFIEKAYRDERDFAIAVLSHERLIQEFSIDITTEYYKILQEEDQINNTRDHIKGLKKALKITRVRTEAGEISKIQLDQSEQELLSAQIDLMAREKIYQEKLDSFKIMLGIPVEAEIICNSKILQKLVDRDIIAVDIDIEQAINLAFETLPELLEKKVAIRDAERDIELAKDTFKPILDASVSLLDLKPTIDFSLEQSLDPADNALALRKAELKLTQASRDYKLLQDTIQQNIRKYYYLFAQSEEDYKLQKQRVEVSKRMSKIATLEQKAGLNNARDVLEAQNKQFTSQNSLTAEFVDYETARLQFLASIGLIEVDEKGLFREK